MKIFIDDSEVEVCDGMSILDAAKQAGVYIPTLCYLKNIQHPGQCRVCLVEVEGSKKLLLACDTKVKEGMKIFTSTERVMSQRKTNIELLLSNHETNCIECPKNNNCKLQSISNSLHCNVEEYEGKRNEYQIDDSSLAIVRNNNKCILCDKCTTTCGVVQNVHALCKSKRGFDTQICCPYNVPLAKSNCVGCGQCTLVCPTAALLEHDNIEDVEKLLNDKNNFVIAMIAPSVRVALSEAFGRPLGTFDEGKMVKSLKLIGFNKVFDINVGADFTVVEEARELLQRLESGERLPQFSSCCPAWVNYVEKFHPELKNNLSDCKSPNEMLGSIVKKYYKDKTEKTIKIVSIMPCTAKKAEIKHHNEIDFAITTRELARMIKQRNIDFNNLKSEHFDNPFADYSGAGLIFGSRGGVTEAVLRTITYNVRNKNQNCNFDIVRNADGIKEFTLTHNGREICGAVVSGLGNAEKVIGELKNGTKKYDFIEFMACPGGCVNGGGQTLVDYEKHDVAEVIEARAKSLYQMDLSRKNKFSNESPVVKWAYKELFNNNIEEIKKTLHN